MKTITKYLTLDNIGDSIRNHDIAINALDFQSETPFIFDKLCQEKYQIPVLHPYNLGWATLVFVLMPNGPDLSLISTDYMGFEKKIVSYINSLFSNEYTDMHLEINNAPKGIKLHSSSLSKIVDSYYEYKPSAMGYTIYGDTIYSGLLKANMLKDKLKTQKDKLSFFAGVFLRYGKTVGTQEYILRLSNSLSKAAFCVELLKELGCKNVENQIKQGMIPTPHWVFFEPSEAILKMIKKVKNIDFETQPSLDDMANALGQTPITRKNDVGPKFNNVLQNDTSVKVFTIVMAGSLNRETAYFLNDKFIEYNLLVSINPELIESLNNIHPSIEIDSVKYQRQIRLIAKNNYFPKAISLTNLKDKYYPGGLKNEPVIFTIDGNIAHGDYNTLEIDENNLYAITLDGNNTKDKIKLQFLKLITKSEANIKNFKTSNTWMTKVGVRLTK